MSTKQQKSLFSFDNIVCIVGFSIVVIVTLGTLIYSFVK